MRKISLCEYCGKEYFSKCSTQKYCSPECARLNQSFYRDRKELLKRCPFCGLEYITSKKQQKYCSQECYKGATNVRQAFYKSRSKATPLLKLRFEVFLRDLFRCQYCGRSAKDGVTLVVDHIIPESKGGKTELSNLTTACQECNSGKSDVLLPPGIPL